jgi:putative solute:sodium symporter small subunit
MDQKISAQKYWRINLKYLSILLFIWFICSFGLSVFFVDALNNFKIGGFPYGFLVCTTGFHLHFCGIDLYLCLLNEQVRQTIWV